jgi:hypothetical protein
LGELKREQFDIEDLRELLDDDSVETADWAAVSLASARFGLESYWDEIWRPWQLSEANRSRDSLDRIRDISHLRVGACAGIAAAYAPSDDLVDRWRTRLQWMEPLLPCGRCPQCRLSATAANADPPPSPEQVWAVKDQDLHELFEFVDAARGVNGVALVTYRSDEEGLAPKIVRGLVDRGVRHVGGRLAPIDPPRGDVLFVDERPLSPADLAPLASFSYFAPGETVSRHWLSRRAGRRLDLNGRPLVDALLLPVETLINGREVGRDLPSIAGATAAELLEKS